MLKEVRQEREGYLQVEELHSSYTNLQLYHF